MAAADAMPVAALLERLDQQRRRAVRLREQARTRQSRSYHLRWRAEAAQQRARSMVNDEQGARASLLRIREREHAAMARDHVRRIASEIQAFLCRMDEASAITEQNSNAATPPAAPVADDGS
jgi:ferredoxin-NADP reductase